MTVELDSPADLPRRVARWIAEGESYEVEFKGEQRERLNDRDLVEAVVCLANGNGGALLVGIEDDGTISGARPRHESGRTDPLRVEALIANMTQPPLSTVVKTVEIDSHEILVVEVPDSPRVVGTTRGTYVRRALAGDGRPTCVPYHAHEMLAHEVDRGAVDWAGLRVSAAAVTFGSVVSSRSNKSRWCGNTSLPTVTSRAPKQRIFARSARIRQVVCYAASPVGAS